MPLPDEDIADIKQSFYDAYSEVYTDSIQFLTFDTTKNKADNIYNEQKYKSFLAPIDLVGKAVLTVGEEIIEIAGQKIPYDIEFTFPSLALENTGVTALGSDLIMNSRIYYNGTYYRIVKFEPTGDISGIYLKYKIKGKKVKNNE